jgi:hypothetical protein
MCKCSTLTRSPPRAYRRPSLDLVSAWQWDRASLVAIDPALRPQYVAKCVELLKPDGRVLLVVMRYDQEKVNGPPFAVHRADVEALYGQDFEITFLQADSLADEVEAGGKWAGLVGDAAGLNQDVYLLTRKQAAAAASKL